jgi:hypothetical protein
VAWALIVAGTVAALLGMLLLTRFGFSAFKGEAVKDMAGWGDIDLGSLDPSALRGALTYLWKEDPRLAAEADEGLRSFEDLRRSQPDVLPRVQHAVRVMYVARYAAIAMVLVGVGAVAGGVWLGPK